MEHAETVKLNNYRNRLIKKIDSLDSYNEKLCYLNDQFIKATSKHEAIVIDLIKRLKNGF